MKPAPFTYHAPRTLNEALEMLATLDNARVLAGGQSLIPMLNFRIVQPEHLIDLGRIAELAYIESLPGALRVGATTTQRMIERSATVQRQCPLLVDALFHVGHQQTRNRGTIGGSLCHLDPSAELPVAACALDPVLTIASHTGRRQISFAEFPADYLTSTLEPNEILIGIDFALCPERTGTAFEEFAVRPADFAIVSVAAVITMDDSDRIAQASIAIGGIAATPMRAADAELLLKGGSADSDLIERAGAAAGALPSAGDETYPAKYRQELAAHLVQRALTKALGRGRL